MVSIFCADVGSVARRRFGWAARLADGSESHGHCIDELCDHVAARLDAGERVALGFECPLFVPMRADAAALTRARRGDGNRSWSAGAGCGALAIGLVQATFVLKRLHEAVPAASVHLQWDDFARSTGGLFLWEALVSGAAKRGSHTGDAQAAVDAFARALPHPARKNVIHETDVISLIGVALLRAGWNVPPSILELPCLVISPAPAPDRRTGPGATSVVGDGMGRGDAGGYRSGLAVVPLVRAR